MAEERDKFKVVRAAALVAVFVATIFAFFLHLGESFQLVIAVIAILAGLLASSDFALLDLVETLALPLAAIFLSWHLTGTHEGKLLLAAGVLAWSCRIGLLRLVSVRRAEKLAYADAIERERPEEATVFVDLDIESVVPVKTLREGHIFRVNPGQILPADGTVTFGSGFVDECLLAGGPEDVRLKGLGSPVYAGTRVRNGSLLVRATAVGATTFAARLANELRLERQSWRLLLPDIFALAFGCVLAGLAGLPLATCALFTSSGASVLAAMAAFDFSLARAGAGRRWYWGENGLRRLRRAGMLVTTAPGVISEGRPKLAAVETTGRLSDDAALGLLGPLARKLETPSALAVLLELRARNIPLQQADFFEAKPDGGKALVDGEEIRWITLRASHDAPLGELESFVREHENAGDELCLLEREGTMQAALAFRDAPVKGVAEAADQLRSEGYPVLLVSPLPKSCTARIQTELGLEHAQGESGERESEALVARLAAEGLSPAWAQTGAFRPAKAAAVVGLSGAARDADLLLPDLSLPDVAGALAFGSRAARNLSRAVGLVLSVQTGLLLLLLASHFRGWAVNPFSFAVAGVIAGFLAFFLAHTASGSDSA